jgi:uncharacterized damage-inducible protein DinB
MHPVLGMFRRNAWATRELLEFCAGLPPEILARADPDVYGSIEAQFNHIVGAEGRYLGRQDGGRPEVSEQTPLSLADLVSPAERCAQRWEALLTSDLEPERVREHETRDGVRFRMADWLGFVQAVHHGDDHRTQVNTLLSRQGIDPPDLSGWVFGDLPQQPGEISASAAALLPRFFGHHLWAQDRLMRWAVRLGDRADDVGAAGTYGTLNATLQHLVFGDHQYLGWLEYPDWATYLAQERDFERRVGDESGWSPAWAVPVQAIHHGNDHRTHVGTVALANAMSCPDLDVWNYAEAVGAYSEG